MSNDPYITLWAATGIGFCVGVIVSLLAIIIFPPKNQKKPAEPTPEQMKETMMSALRKFNESRK